MNAENKKALKELEELQKRCAVRGWDFNNFTAYLLETNRNASIIAYCMGVSRCTCYYWLNQKELSASVNFLFLIARKLRQQKGIDIFDLV